MKTRKQIIEFFVLEPSDLAFVDRLRAVQIAGARHGKAGYYPDGDFSSDADWAYGVGAEITALEAALECDGGEVFELYIDAHSAFYRDGTINPGDRSDGGIYDFQFSNGCGNIPGITRVSVHARSCEDALELAAEWLADNAPGLIMPEGDEHLEELRREACEEAGLPYPPSDDADWEEYYELFDRTAHADLTYTESGYLESWNWYVDGPR